MRKLFEAPRGMRDFYPEDMQAQTAIFNAWTQASLQFGFLRYDSCIVESLDLLKHKSGREIADQVYAFRDKSGRDLALRPEMTPTLARMIAARRGSLAFPLKWFAIAQCFRYERTSRGRKREHYQWNLDIVGETELSAEAEIIACALHALLLLGLDPGDVLVHLSSRALLADLLLKMQVPKQFHQAAFLALDKKGKMDDDAVRLMLQDSGLERDSVDAVFKVVAINSIGQAEQILGVTTPSIQAIRSLMDVLEVYGVADSVRFDLSVVRGLDYYTGIVFEAFDSRKDLRAVFGGGRYDRLLEDMGGGKLTAVGLGFGDVVISELLKQRGMSERTLQQTDFAVGYMDAAQQTAAAGLAKILRGAGKSVDLALHPEKAKNFFSRAGSGRYMNAAFIGPDDIARGKVRVKNLLDRTETETELQA